MDRSSNILLLIIILLIFTAGAALVLDMPFRQDRRIEKAMIFQRATGGLGMGAIATPIWNRVDYDPRLLSVEECIAWPVPGGYSYGPDRAATVTFFTEQAGNQWIIITP
jgi:hypothetical protein